MRSLLVVTAVAIAAGCAGNGRQAPPPPPAPTVVKAEFTIAVQGDNRGEIAPCGCAQSQDGGLARRATAVRQAFDAGPTLLLDAGDALFSSTTQRTEGDEEKAALILSSMGRTRTAAMAVGDRDLLLGVDWLVATAREHEVPLLSANVRTEDGERPFLPRKRFAVDDAEVGVFAVFGQREGQRPIAGLVVEDPVAAAAAQVEALRAEGADLVVALVHGPTALVRQVAAIEGLDLLVPSHDGSLSLPYRTGPEAAWIVGAGRLGRTISMIRMNLEGEGELMDEGQRARLVEEREGLATRLAEASKLYSTTAAQQPPESREALAETIRVLDRRIAEVDRQIGVLPAQGGPRFRVETIALHDGFEDDPELAVLVKAFEEGAAAAR
ncbi:MAG TPA: hypothetical protein VN033_01345 [Vulgatibacter sp.]|nr:hypothetical protein [Vulgatibacter sp.]